MKDGYIRIGASSFDTSITNVIDNVQKIKENISKAYQNNAKILIFPELCITGYTCEDLFLQETLLHQAKKGLDDVIDYTKSYDMVVCVGLPYVHKNDLYNVAAIIHQGNLLGFIPKQHIPNYQEFYEARRFKACPSENTYTCYRNQQIPFGNKFIFQNRLNKDICLGIEICEDVWLPNAPSNQLVLEGATLILNLSASNEITTKASYRRSMIQSQSAKGLCGYVYCNAGNGESSTDVVFSGHHLLCENGTILAESEMFEPSTIYADFDVKKLNSERRKMTTFSSSNEYETIYFQSTNIDLSLERFYDPHPFVPSDSSKRQIRCKEVFDIQIYALMQRLKATKIDKVVIGISGGLDSTLALLVCTMAFQKMNLPTSNIYAITMPCFGTTSRTKNNALGLMDHLKVTSLTIDITKSVEVQFTDLQQDPTIHDITYENVQARTRTQILMNKANQIGGLVIGTGDLSEVALGWSTYNGDHMSMYAINVSVPKTLVRYLVDYVSSMYPNSEIYTILQDILDTPVSPELLPAKENEIVQKTEDIVGPYELHDFFLYHMIRFGDRPRKIYRKTQIAFSKKYDNETIIKWLTLYYRRFFTQQFKRSCIPDGPKVGSVSLSPRGDLRMPSDASYHLWLEELKKIDT
ncbi:NAD(+) synthase [Tannockella kyphosi]|uniref:NAD(+) synthase n=1 Tax=Tannockella kyphosi TaxID=2899121 RepID=UPI002013518D|nr:NAD(+) synthase [Tannockella kyphosi]